MSYLDKVAVIRICVYMASAYMGPLRTGGLLERATEAVEYGQDKKYRARRGGQAVLQNSWIGLVRRGVQPLRAAAVPVMVHPPFIW